MSSSMADCSLHIDEHFVREHSALGGRVWAVRHRRPVSWIATFWNMYVLLGAVRAIQSFTRLGPDDYDHSLDSCYAAVSVTCRSQLSAEERSGLHHAKHFWWWAAHTLIVLLLLCDLARLTGMRAATDSALGFYSERAEGRRGYSYLAVAFGAFAHLGYWYAQPVRVPCCVGTPKPDVVLDRMRTLAVLLFVTGYCLLGDAHNHGYFLLRIPASERNTLALLRSELPRRLGSPSATDGAEGTQLVEDESGAGP